MSEIPGRLYNLAKAYLDAAKERIGEIDSRAQDELNQALNRAESALPPASSDDPMARAQAKIDASRQRTNSRRELPPATSTAPDFSQPATAFAPSALETAYKVVGVPSGSDILTVQAAVNKLRERCAPSRFPDGSEAQAEAKALLQKVEDAYRVIKIALDPMEGRFDRLEI